MLFNAFISFKLEKFNSQLKTPLLSLIQGSNALLSPIPTNGSRGLLSMSSYSQPPIIFHCHPPLMNTPSSKNFRALKTFEMRAFKVSRRIFHCYQKTGLPTVVNQTDWAAASTLHRQNATKYFNKILGAALPGIIALSLSLSFFPPFYL
jgi:hypothetical protein